MVFCRIPRPVRAGTLLVALALAACGPSTAPSAQPSAAPPVELPSTGTADYQLGGAYPPPDGTTIVARDSGDSPADGTYGLCYVNGFQSQPGDSERWATRGLLLLDEAGQPVVDEGWPDEMLLDTSTEQSRAGIADELATELHRCADAGFDAVELDNLDSWTRSDGRLTQDDAVALATELVRAAHRLGLAAAQKNTPQLGAVGRDTVGFDLAVAEECVQYDECAAYTDVYGQDVIDIEYVEPVQTASDLADQVCDTPARPDRLVIRDRDLTPAGAVGHAYAACPSPAGR
ncbi:endo alpha-1,4 polygalactosaminidase [Cellulomonas soli]